MQAPRRRSGTDAMHRGGGPRAHKPASVLGELAHLLYHVRAVVRAGGKRGHIGGPLDREPRASSWHPDIGVAAIRAASTSIQRKDNLGGGRLYKEQGLLQIGRASHPDFLL